MPNRISGIMQRNDRFRIQDKLPKPKVVRWNSRQIASLLANELMHFYENERKGKYIGGGRPKSIDKVLLEGGFNVWDFNLNLATEPLTWYRDLNSANQIMQAIYNQRIFWEPLKPKK